MGVTEGVLNVGMREEVSDQLGAVFSVRRTDIDFAFESTQYCFVQILLSFI